MENKETLASALCKAQSEFLPASQSGYNPHFKSSFSTMTDLIRATRPALKKYGLAVLQYPVVVGDNNMVLETIIAGHDSTFVSVTPIALKDPSDMQAFGKACSYITRYVYKMMLGIEAADEDDDGNASANLSNGNSPKGVATEAQVKFLSQLLVGKDEIKNSLLKAEGVENLSQLSFDMVSKAITKLKGQ